MVKFISKIIGSKVVSFQERALLGLVERVLIDPADGTFVGLVVRVAFDQEERYVALGDIKGFAQGLVIVEELNSLSGPDEIIRLGEVLKNEPRLIGASVVTESGQKLGRVEEATIDIGLAVLKKLYVSPRFLPAILGEAKIIDARQIVKIGQREIIVRDTKTKIKKMLALPTEAPISE
jgi:sporulation protein YlmC with PRC-barrel domain